MPNHVHTVAEPADDAAQQCPRGVVLGDEVAAVVEESGRAHLAVGDLVEPPERIVAQRRGGQLDAILSTTFPRIIKKINKKKKLPAKSFSFLIQPNGD